MAFTAKSTVLLALLATALASYDESLARNKMMPLSGAAYSGNPAACLQNAFSNAELKRQISVKCDAFKGDTCSGFTAVSHGDQAVIVSFRGTSGFLQLLSEGGESIFQKKVPSLIGGSVNEYFNKAFNDIWVAGMKDDFLSLKNAYPGYKVWVTGHSLGGSMASICATNIISLGYAQASNVWLYTLGQPRTGDSAFAAAHDALGFAAVYRVTHQQDMVPHVPPEGMMGYRHHANEVWYNDDMSIGASYVECDAEEGDSCSDSNLLDLSINEHLHYFDKDVSGYGDAGCIGSFKQAFPELREEDFKNVPHDQPGHVFNP